MEGMLAAFRVLQVDPLPAVRFASNKQVQLDIAREVGLTTPRTLTTNDEGAARAFAATCPGGVIAKMLSSFAVYRDGEEQVVFTNALGAKDLADMRGLSLCPMTFQENIPKARELRVHGRWRARLRPRSTRRRRPAPRSTGAGRGSSSSTPGARTRSRPTSRRGVLRLMDRLGLNYGASTSSARRTAGTSSSRSTRPASSSGWSGPPGSRSARRSPRSCSARRRGAARGAPSSTRRRRSPAEPTARRLAERVRTLGTARPARASSTT